MPLMAPINAAKVKPSDRSGQAWAASVNEASPAIMLAAPFTASIAMAISPLVSVKESNGTVTVTGAGCNETVKVK